MEWAREKANRAKRAAFLSEEMRKAIARKDKEEFKKLYISSLNYTTKKERSPLYREFVKMCCKS